MSPKQLVVSIERQHGYKQVPIGRQIRFEDLPDLLSVPEFCRYTGIGRSLGYELIKTGQVHSIRLGRRVMVPRWAIQHLLGLEK